MNAKRKKKNFSISELVLLGVAALILAVGGIMHAYAKNTDIEQARTIDAAQKQIEQYDEAVAMTNVKSERMLGRFLLKDNLKNQKSSLRETDSKQLLYVNPSGQGSLVRTP